jgi:hypothetical protein
MAGALTSTTAASAAPSSAAPANSPRTGTFQLPGGLTVRPGPAAQGPAAQVPAPQGPAAQGPAAQVPAPQAVILSVGNGLESVYCTTAANCWAVGSVRHGGANLNEVLHWTGKKWFKVAVPSPGGTAKDDVSQLDSVRCTSLANCWAVGSYERKGAVLGQALHWTGHRWFLVATPTPGGTLKNGLNDLIDVACTSAGSCWATGSYGNLGSSTGVILNLALHWNGTTWSQVPVPNPGGSGKGKGHLLSLDAVRCTGPKTCWAVGFAGILSNKIVFRNEVLRWDGKKWSAAPVPNPAGVGKDHINELVGLSCTASDSCWATGDYGSINKLLNEALHWNGRKWLKVRTPNPEGSALGSSNSLAGVSCTSSKDCWAVGTLSMVTVMVMETSRSTSPSSPTENEALHWNGKSWTKASLPQPGGTAGGDTSELVGVRCTSPTNCWAVGDQQKKNGPDVAQILRWNGVKWVTG